MASCRKPANIPTAVKSLEIAMATTRNESYAVPTLSKLIDLHGNDWEKENQIFREMTLRNLDDQEPLEFDTQWNLLSAWNVGRRISLNASIVLIAVLL